MSFLNQARWHSLYPIHLHHSSHHHRIYLDPSFSEPADSYRIWVIGLPTPKDQHNHRECNKHAAHPVRSSALGHPCAFTVHGYGLESEEQGIQSNRQLVTRYEQQQARLRDRKSFIKQFNIMVEEWRKTRRIRISEGTLVDELQTDSAAPQAEDDSFLFPITRLHPDRLEARRDFLRVKRITRKSKCRRAVPFHACPVRVWRMLLWPRTHRELRQQFQSSTPRPSTPHV